MIVCKLNCISAVTTWYMWSTIHSSSIFLPVSIAITAELFLETSVLPATVVEKCTCSDSRLTRTVLQLLPQYCMLQSLSIGYIKPWPRVYFSEVISHERSGVSHHARFLWGIKSCPITNCRVVECKASIHGRLKWVVSSSEECGDTSALHTRC